jgi:hypothetical protein
MAGILTVHTVAVPSQAARLDGDCFHDTGLSVSAMFLHLPEQGGATASYAGRMAMTLGMRSQVPFPVFWVP